MKKYFINSAISILIPATLLLYSCKGKDTLVYDANRIDTFTMTYYEDYQEHGEAVITDQTVIAEFASRYENINVWAIPGNDEDPYLNINYPHGYNRIYGITIHLAGQGLFKTEGTYWLEFGYNSELDAYRFVTFSGYEYRYTNDYPASEKTYLDGIFSQTSGNVGN